MLHTHTVYEHTFQASNGLVLMTRCIFRTLGYIQPVFSFRAYPFLSKNTILTVPNSSECTIQGPSPVKDALILGTGISRKPWGNLYNLYIYKRLNFQIANTVHGLLGCSYRYFRSCIGFCKSRHHQGVPWSHLQKNICVPL